MQGVSFPRARQNPLRMVMNTANIPTVPASDVLIAAIHSKQSYKKLNGQIILCIGGGGGADTLDHKLDTSLCYFSRTNQPNGGGEAIPAAGDIHLQVTSFELPSKT